MASPPANVILRHVRRLANTGDDVPDADLLRRFVARRDEAAFTALVQRYGSMVLAVCRSVLRQQQDAEDAFQATFLILARKASAIRKPAEVGSWLYGTAYRVALNARAAALRRQAHERAAEPSPAPADSVTWGELRQVLHEELARLPDQFRAPLLLCYLEGLTQDEAAQRLGWPATTLKGRVNRGRDLLRRRLARRGFALSAPLFAALFTAGAADALPPAVTLVRTTIAAALGAAPASVAALADGLARWAIPGKMKLLCAVLLVAGALAAGAPLLSPAPSPAAGPTFEGPAQAEGRDDKPAGPGTKEAKADDDPLPEGAVARLGSRRLRHAGEVQTVAFSPDGKLLVSAGGDANVRLWGPATGKAVRQIERCYNAAAFSPDGEWLAVAEDGTTIVLHEASVGDNRRRIGIHDGGIHALAFSRDGKWLASGGRTGTLIVWDVAGAKPKHLLRLRGKGPETGRSLAFSPDGKVLAAADFRGNARAWDAGTGEVLYDFSAAAVAFSPDGKLLAAFDLAGHLRLLDPRSGKEVGAMAVERSGPDVSVAFSPDGKLLATGGDAAVRLFDVAGRRQLHEAAAHGGTPCVAFSPDGKALASAAGYALRLWDVPSWKERFPLAGHTTQIDALAYSPDGKTLASGGFYDNRLLLWDVGTAKVRRTLDCEQQGVFCATFSPDGKSVAAGLTDNGPPHRVVAVWDAGSGKRLRRLESQFGASSVVYSPDGKRLAASGSSGIAVWGAANGERLAVLQPNGQMIHSLAFLRGGKSLLFTSYKLPLSEWDVATGNELRQFEGKPLPHLRMELAPGGRYVAVGWRYGTDTPQKNPIRIWEVATGQEVAALCPDYSMADEIAYSADGRLIACLRHDATIRIHDVLTGDELRRFHDPASPRLITFSPDGQTLASAGWDTTITLWNVKDLAHRKPPRRAPLSAERLAALWSDLEGGDAAKAYEAVRALARVPDQAVPLLRQRLAQPAPADKRVGKLIADLDDDEFDVRERASAELERLGAATEAAMRKALEGKPSAEAKRRIEALLAKRSPAGVSRERLTALRALEVLELAGTPEARRLVKSLAEGTPGAPATEAAREALQRPGR